MGEVSILVCGDAGPAGRDLLARRDLDLRWALTQPEIEASAKTQRPALFLVRQVLADECLAVAKRYRGTPVVVLMDNWEQRQRYFDMGATALVGAQGLDRVLEAIGELTGLQNSHIPRVPFEEVVDVQAGDDSAYVEAVELSTSGLAVRDLPPWGAGTQVEVSFVLQDLPLTISAVVIRNEPGAKFARLSFNALSDQDREPLEAMVDRIKADMAPLPEPEDLTSDLNGTFTLDLVSAMAEEGAPKDRWVEMLRKHLFPLPDEEEERVPRWLRRVGRDLTKLEHRALIGAKAPPFARAALEMRVDLARSRAYSVTGLPSREDGEMALDFCRTLALDAEGFPTKELGQVALIRAQLLSMVYGAGYAQRDASDKSQSKASSSARAQV